MAEEFLGKNPNNRNINRNRVRGMVSDMAEGRWLLNAQPIIFDKDGNLLDGQHRLSAVVASGVPTEFSVCYGADSSMMPVIDHVASRTTADLLSIEGYQNAAIIAAIARKIVAYKNGSRSIASNSSNSSSAANNVEVATKQEVAMFARQNYDAIADVAKTGSMICDKTKITLLAGSEIGFFLYVLVPQGAAEEFFLKVVGGIGLEVDTPEHSLRKTIELGRVAKKRVITSAQLTKAVFDAFEKSQRLSKAIDQPK